MHAYAERHTCFFLTAKGRICVDSVRGGADEKFKCSPHGNESRCISSRETRQCNRYASQKFSSHSTTLPLLNLINTLHAHTHTHTHTYLRARANDVYVHCAAHASPAPNYFGVQGKRHSNICNGRKWLLWKVMAQQTNTVARETSTCLTSARSSTSPRPHVCNLNHSTALSATPHR